MNKLHKAIVVAVAIIISVAGFIYWKSDQPVDTKEVAIESLGEETSVPNLESDGPATTNPENGQSSIDQLPNSSDANMGVTASAPIEELQANIDQMNQLRALYHSADANSDDLLALVAEAASGNVESSILLHEQYLQCIARFNHISDEKKELCTQIQSEMLSQGIDHPFFLVENLALEGNLTARFNYLDSLGIAIDSKAINPITEVEQWRQRKENALAWQLELTRMGNSASAFAMASQYMYGPLVENSPLHALAFVKQARFLGYENSRTLDVLYERALLAYEGDMQDVDDLYAQLFND